MRLWHYKLLPYLPNSQIIAQWRELNSIFKKQAKHILINYIYNYDDIHLYQYSLIVINEMDKRNIKHDNTKMLNYFSSFLDKYNDFQIFGLLSSNLNDLFYNEFNDRYLLQCFYNLQEKYDRGQKNFSEECYLKLEQFIKSKLNINII